MNLCTLKTDSVRIKKIKISKHMLLWLMLLLRILLQPQKQFEEQSNEGSDKALQFNYHASTDITSITVVWYVLYSFIRVYWVLSSSSTTAKDAMFSLVFVPQQDCARSSQATFIDHGLLPCEECFPSWLWSYPKWPNDSHFGFLLNTLPSEYNKVNLKASLKSCILLA